LLSAAVALAAVLMVTACQPTTVPPTAPGTQRVVLFGDSVPAWLVRDGVSGVNKSKYTFIDGTLAACDGAKSYPPARSRSGDPVPVTDSCIKGWPILYPGKLTVHADVAVLMVGMHAMLDHKFNGVWTHPCRAAARNWYRDDVTERLGYLATKATRVVLVLPAWPGPNSGWIMPADYVKRANCVREVMQDAAAATSTTTSVVDFGPYLCGATQTACKWRDTDGVHVDKAKASTVMSWLLATTAPPPA